MPHIIPLIGPKSGKTELAYRLADKPFEENRKARTGTQILKKKNSELQYWDFGPDIGQELINASFSKASGIALVFDATDDVWTQTLENYLSENEIEFPPNVPVFLIATRIDLLEEENQQKLLSAMKKSSLAKLNKASSLIVSSLNNTNIDSLLDQMTNNLPEQNDQGIMLSQRRRESFSRTLNQMHAQINRGESIDPQMFINTISEAPAEYCDDEHTNKIVNEIASSVKKGANHTPRMNYTEKVPGENIARQLFQDESTNPPVAPTANGTYASFALRLVGLALLAVAIVNLIYLMLILTHVFSMAALVEGMNLLLTATGGLLGVSAPVTAYANVCASIGMTTNLATGLLSSGASVLLGTIGLSLFCSPKVTSPVEPITQPLNNTL